MKKTDLFDFSYMTSLTVKAAGEDRVFLTKTAESESQAPTILFVHGGYHGAWCFAHYLSYFEALGIPAAAMDQRGHGGLPQDANFPDAGVAEMAEDVVASCNALSGPAILVGHSLGGLVAAAAGERVPLAGFGLLAPSPPGQLEGAAPLPPVPEGGPLPPPSAEVCGDKFLAGQIAGELGPFVSRLCPESPRLLNDRYLLRIAIDQSKFAVPAICIEAGLDTKALHPPGQDQKVAEFYGAEYHYLDRTPHCMMISSDWQDSASLLADWYRRSF